MHLAPPSKLAHGPDQPSWPGPTSRAAVDAAGSIRDFTIRTGIPHPANPEPEKRFESTNLPPRPTPRLRLAAPSIVSSSRGLGYSCNHPKSPTPKGGRLKPQIILGNPWQNFPLRCKLDAKITSYELRNFSFRSFTDQKLLYKSQHLLSPKFSEWLF